MIQTVTHSTFVVERRYAKSPADVFFALTDPARRKRWYAESDQHEIVEYEADVRPGGRDRLSYLFTGDAPVRGMTIANEGRFENLVPGQCLVTSGSMWVEDHCISTSLVTMELFADEDGARLVCTHQGVFFPGADGPEIRERGWQVLLGKIAEALE